MDARNCIYDLEQRGVDYNDSLLSIMFVFCKTTRSLSCKQINVKYVPEHILNAFGIGFLSTFLKTAFQYTINYRNKN